MKKVIGLVLLAGLLCQGSAFAQMSNPSLRITKYIVNLKQDDGKAVLVNGKPIVLSAQFETVLTANGIKDCPKFAPIEGNPDLQVTLPDLIAKKSPECQYNFEVAYGAKGIAAAAGENHIYMIGDLRDQNQPALDKAWGVKLSYDDQLNPTLSLEPVTIRRNK